MSWNWRWSLVLAREYLCPPGLLVRLLVCILHLENRGLDSSSHGHKLRVGTMVK